MKCINLRFNFKNIIFGLLVFGVLTIGIECLCFGIYDAYVFGKKTKNYLITDGYYKNYDLSGITKDGEKAYKLNYIYEIDGKRYTVSTKYGVSFKYIPKYNSERKVKYNPNNYSEAVLCGTNRSNYLIYFGAFFTFVGFTFILGILYMNGAFDKVKFNVFEIYIGVVIVIVCVGIILFQIGMGISIKEIIKTMGVFVLIPILFLVVGIYLIIRSLFFKRISRS